jgi:uncharacterized phage-associated protein
MATYSAHDIAAEIRKRLPGVGAKKLHKLLYYCQGYHLGTLGAPMFKDELEAWDRGPVVASLWRDEKYTQHATPPGDRESFDEATLNTIGYVLSRYGAMTGADLERLTHNEPPWQLANERRRTSSDQRLALNEIRDYFAANPPSDESDEADDYDVVHPAEQEWLKGALDRRNDALRVDNRAAIRALAGR